MVGFYFGRKNALAIQNNQAKSEVLGLAENIQRQTVKVLEVPGVYWIKPNQEPICPETHPIKGTFTTTQGYFYLPDHKNYKLVKADICFVNEEFARDVAGFIRKF